MLALVESDRPPPLAPREDRHVEQRHDPLRREVVACLGRQVLHVDHPRLATPERGLPSLLRGIEGLVDRRRVADLRLDAGRAPLEPVRAAAFVARQLDVLEHVDPGDLRGLTEAAQDHVDHVLPPVAWRKSWAAAPTVCRIESRRPRASSCRTASDASVNEAIRWGAPPISVSPTAIRAKASSPSGSR